MSDGELWILREMELYGDRARREFVTQRDGGKGNPIWFGTRPLDYYESRWIYDAMDGDMRKKGFLDVMGNDYTVTAHGERALAAHQGRRLENVPPVVDALTGQPYE
jgi:hypothetical protein